MIGSAVAIGVLYSYLSYASLSCLGAIPIGIALIVVGIRCGSSGTYQSNSRSGEPTRVMGDPPPISTLIEKPLWNGQNVVTITIGSPESRLEEKVIQRELEAFRDKKDIDNLVIYGNGNVRFNTDPGFVTLNPKKVILVGAWIIHAPCNGRGLDETLASTKGWLANPTMRTCVLGSDPEDMTHIMQYKKASVLAALNDNPGNYRIVYLVNEI